MEQEELRCYACGETAVACCITCERPYCDAHGQRLCADCSHPLKGLPSPYVFRGAVALLIVVVLASAWFLALNGETSLLARSDGQAGLTEPVQVKGASQEKLGPGIVAPVGATFTPTRVSTAPTVPAQATPTRLAATPTPTAGPARKYIVVQGDSVYLIAQKFGVDPDAIITLNKLAQPEKLQIGDELLLPSR